MSTKQNIHLSLDIRIGKITAVDLIQNPKYATHNVKIDFGDEVEARTSVARLVRYEPAELVGKMVTAIVNLPPKKIGGLVSNALLLGTPDASGDCILIVPEDKGAIIGQPVF